MLEDVAASRQIVKYEDLQAFRLQLHFLYEARTSEGHEAAGSEASDEEEQPQK